MGEVIDWLGELSEVARRDYQVDPRIFIAIYLASIPLFWVAFAGAVTEVVRLRRARLPYRSRRLTTWVTVVAASWLAPYLYVMVWGRNLPWFVWIVIGLLVLLSGLRLLRAAKRKSRDLDAGAGPADGATAADGTGDDR